VSGGGLVGVDRNRATGHDSTRDLDLDVENKLTNSNKGFLRRFKRRRRRATRRGGRWRKAYSGELLRAAQVTRASTTALATSAPPREPPEQLHVEGEAATEEIEGGGALGFGGGGIEACG
jgi:hypothetical protein